MIGIETAFGLNRSGGFHVCYTVPAGAGLESRIAMKYALTSPEFPCDELARASRDGNLECFDRLVATLSRTLIARAFRYTRDWDSAEDLCQETWLAVHERIRSYDPERPFMNWLLAIHRRRCLDHLRKASVRKERAVAVLPDAAPLGAGRGEDPEELTAQREFMTRLGRALPALSERQRRAFALVDIEQTEQKEAAAILGIAFATLRSTLHGARRRLAALLKEA